MSEGRAKEQIVDLYQLDFMGSMFLANEKVMAREMPFSATNNRTGITYHAYHLENGEMMLVSPITGKKFVFGWNDVLTVAIHRGIDREFNPDRVQDLEGVDFKNV